MDFKINLEKSKSLNFILREQFDQKLFLVISFQSINGKKSINKLKVRKFSYNLLTILCRDHLGKR